MNRRERRHVEKDKRTASTADDNNEVIEKLVQFKEDDTGLKLTDLLPLKIVIGVWNMTLGKILYVSPSSKAEVKRNTPSEEDILDTPIKVKSDGDKITLSNGKVLHSRKK
jgi:hypothetical protein